MTADEFRQLALSLPEATEGAHMGHADFRVGGKIFATLGHPEDNVGMVKLTPPQQGEWTASHGGVFRPVPGGWGHQGATHVLLPRATEGVVRPALIAAWRNAAPKRLAAQYADDSL